MSKVNAFGAMVFLVLVFSAMACMPRTDTGLSLESWPTPIARSVGGVFPFIPRERYTLQDALFLGYWEHRGTFSENTKPEGRIVFDFRGKSLGIIVYEGKPAAVSLRLKPEAKNPGDPVNLDGGSYVIDGDKMLFEGSEAKLYTAILEIHDPGLRVMGFKIDGYKYYFVGSRGD